MFVTGWNSGDERIQWVQLHTTWADWMCRVYTNLRKFSVSGASWDWYGTNRVPKEYQERKIFPTHKSESEQEGINVKCTAALKAQYKSNHIQYIDTCMHVYLYHYTHSTWYIYILILCNVRRMNISYSTVRFELHICPSNPVHSLYSSSDKQSLKSFWQQFPKWKNKTDTQEADSHSALVKLWSVHGKPFNITLWNLCLWRFTSFHIHQDAGAAEARKLSFICPCLLQEMKIRWRVVGRHDLHENDHSNEQHLDPTCLSIRCIA